VCRSHAYTRQISLQLHARQTASTSLPQCAQSCCIAIYKTSRERAGPQFHCATICRGTMSELAGTLVTQQQYTTHLLADCKRIQTYVENLKPPNYDDANTHNKTESTCSEEFDLSISTRTASQPEPMLLLLISTRSTQHHCKRPSASQ
jgi:hypothetical protein